MVTLRVDADQYKIFDEIIKESRTAAKEGIIKAAKRVPDMIRSNIDAQSTERQLPRGGSAVWPRVSLRGLRARKTWPDKDHFGKFTAGQLRMFQTHTPLIDTGNYYASFREMDREDTRDLFAINVSTPDPRGIRHENGIGSGAFPNIPARVHMFIVEGEDTDALFDDFSKAVSR